MNDLEQRRAAALLGRENAKTIALHHPDPTVRRKALAIYNTKLKEAARLYDEMEAARCC